MNDDPEANGGWRARVIGDDMATLGLRIVAGRRYIGAPMGEHVTAIGARGLDTEVHDAAVVPPHLVVPEGLARALLDALAEHFGGTSVGRQARADFLHERGRVDKLIDTVTIIATKDSER